MVKCKVCNKRIDFDEKDKSVVLGENLKTVGEELIKIPEYGKFAYIRRGRWYWHPQCYPDNLGISNIIDEKSVEIKTKQIQSMEETLKATHDELQKTLEENSKLIDDVAKQTARADDSVKLHNEVVEERHRCFDELSIYKTDYAKLKNQKELLEIQMKAARLKIDELEKFKADLALAVSNGENQQNAPQE